MNSLPTILSAATTSNRLTLGNYLGAIVNWVSLQTSHRCFFMAADLHSITTPQDPKTLRSRSLEFLATYIACGIDPKKAVLFVQSERPEHAQLAWILTCNATMGELSRMTQFKEKSTKEDAHIPAGLFAYPTLMAADILLYDTDLVPVGEDQKQHLELTRDLAQRVNHHFGSDVFKLPKAYTPPVGARIMSLQDPTAKMSKSDPDPHATVYLNDSDSEILKKFKRAITDSGSEITEACLAPDSPQAGVRNLITIQAALGRETASQVLKRYLGRQYGHLKVETAERVIAVLNPIRTEAARLLSDRGELERTLAPSVEKAGETASRVLDRVYRAVGLR